MFLNICDYLNIVVASLLMTHIIMNKDASLVPIQPRLDCSLVAIWDGLSNIPQADKQSALFVLYLLLLLFLLLLFVGVVVVIVIDAVVEYYLLTKVNF